MQIHSAKTMAIIMKKFVLGLFAISVLASCKSQLEKAKTSADKAFIMKVADEQYSKKKWKNAIVLYDRLGNLVAGTDDASNVGYNSAYAHYNDKQYRLAGYKFKNFAVNNFSDPRKEDASYMSALCFYKGSMDYNLDQSSTEMAINELQNFLNTYPDSEKSKNINTLIDELTYKTEFKAYENAKQYYKMAQYLAAITAFENVLNDFPSTKLRTQIYDYVLKSRYELAMGSNFTLKDERIDNAIAYTRFVEKELPNSEYSKSAIELRTKLEKEKKDFAVIKKQQEAKIAILTEKQKKEAEKLSTTDAQAKKQVQDEQKAMQIQRDSAAINTPPPAATFKIRR